jgi:hypothetical protein
LPADDMHKTALSTVDLAGLARTIEAMAATALYVDPDGIYAGVRGVSYGEDAHGWRAY